MEAAKRGRSRRVKVLMLASRLSRCDQWGGSFSNEVDDRTRAANLWASATPCRVSLMSALYAYFFHPIGGQLQAITWTLVSRWAYPLMCKIVSRNFVSTIVAAQDISAWTFAWPNSALNLPGKSMHMDALRAISFLPGFCPANTIQSLEEVFMNIIQQ